MPRIRNWRKLFIADGGIRPVWRIGLYVPVLVLTAAVVGITGKTLISLLGLPSDSYSLAGLLRKTISHLGITLLVIVGGSWICVRFLDKRQWKTFGLDFHRGWFLELGIGVLTGVGMVGILFIIEWLAGWIEIQGSGWQGRSTREMLALVYVAIITNIEVAVLEEVPLRGYLLQTLEEWLGTPAALIFTSLFFGLVHLSNPSASSWTIYVIPLALTLFGFVLGLAYLARRSVWLPLGLHFAWNFCEYHVFSLTVAEPGEAVFLSTKINGPAWGVGFPASAFGPEVGLLGILVMLLAAGLFWQMGRKKAHPKSIAVPLEALPRPGPEGDSVSREPTQGIAAGIEESANDRPKAQLPAIVYQAFLFWNVGGKEAYHEISSGISMGRSSEADVFVDDLSVSRLHCRIEPEFAPCPFAEQALCPPATLELCPYAAPAPYTSTRPAADAATVPASCSFPVPALRLSAARYALVDIGSTNGTFLNDNQVKDRLPLKDGDVIRLGSSRFRFELVGH